MKPGFVDTRMMVGKDSPLTVSPEAAARDIYEGIKHRKDTVYVPWFWRIVMFVIDIIPERLFKKLKM